jgi:hypothetical protein
MLSVYALLCAAAVARGDCSVDNAIDVIRMPDAANELNCLEDTVVTLAALAIQPNGGEYWKVVCARPGNIEIEIARRNRSLEQTPSVDYRRG